MGALLGLFSLSGVAADRYVGGDISELPTMEKAGSKYYDKNGSLISDLITYSHDQGMNAMRVRLFVDPDKYTGSDKDQYACQSYDYILPICKRIKESGMSLLLDFHYSDTWADPAKQWTPADWASLSDDQLYTKIYDYTKEVLTNLKAEGVVPDFIQTGNEISYGMCWGPYGTSSPKKAYTSQANSGSNATNLTRFANLLKNAIAACREVCPKAKIVLHTERVAQASVTTSFYDWAKNNNLDYDIIGLSYYYYYHGAVSQLETTLKTIDNKKYGKDIWIVETGSPLNWAISGSDSYYPVTADGQNQFMNDLIAVLDNHSSVTGLFWWEMDYNAYGTSLTNWYNGGLFNNQNGKISSAFYTLAAWGDGEPNEDNGNDGPVDYYLLYNQGGDWVVPGTKFNDNGDGTYNLKNINIYQDGNENGWFGITTSSSTDWDEINANRLGPTTHNEDPSKIQHSPYESNTNSWQVVAGKYHITLDTNNNHIVVENAETTGIDDVIADETAEPVYYNLQGVRVKNPTNGVYVRVVGGKSSKVLITK